MRRTIIGLVVLLLGNILNSHAHASLSEVPDKLDECTEKTVYLSSLKETWLIKAKFNKHEVWVYKRNNNQKLNSRSSENIGYDDKNPYWWDYENSPVDFVVSQKNIRSLEDNYFVFYAYGPVSGYYLMYFSEKNNGRDQYGFLGNNWEGGFVDVINQIGYDYSGRPVVVDLPKTSSPQEGVLSNLNLLVPRYKYDRDLSTITILCK